MYCHILNDQPFQCVSPANVFAWGIEVRVVCCRISLLEVAVAQVCREAGARVSTDLHVRDMDLAEFNNLDGRRLEVVA